MKVLGRIGLIVAAAAVILFIFIFELYKPNSANKAMKAPPEESSEYSFFQDADQIETTENTISEDKETEQPDDTSEEQTPEVLQSQTSEPLAEEIAEDPVVEEVIQEAVTAEVQNNTPEINMRNIYGKISLASTGENLAGVNVMIPGSSVAKISNNIGGYTIQVPQGTRELVFIYRGKKMVQRLNPSNNLLNVQLNLETMEYD